MTKSNSHTDVLDAVRGTLINACNRAASPEDVRVVAELLTAYTGAKDWMMPSRSHPVTTER